MMTTKSTCHAVPCHIAYSGPANGIDTYFTPMDITSVVTKGNPEPTISDRLHKENEKNELCYQAATIRGRGLIAVRNTTDEKLHKYDGHVFQVINKNLTSVEYHNNIKDTITDDSIHQQKYLQSIQTFDQYVQWYHEHQPSNIVPTSSSSSSSTMGGTTTVNTRFDRAIEWIHTADCLHAPTPVPGTK
jgi:hypothetical protein